MKKVFALALAASLALALFALLGCGQDNRRVPAEATAGDTCVSFIDVGKGDCILLQAGDSAALIDTGYDSTSADVLSYLKQRGVSHLDYLIITHYDRDHVEGIRSIGAALAIDAVYLPGYEGSDKNYSKTLSTLENLGLSAQRVTEKLSLKLGDNDLGVFPSSVDYIPASKGKEGNDNDLSLVASLTGNGASYLFAGDLEEDGIAAYLEGEHGRFDVLKMPHHGKRSSGTDEFLEDTRPQIAIITDSIDDPADKKTLKALKAIGADVYRTSTSGTVVVSNDGAGRYSVSELGA